MLLLAYLANWSIDAPFRHMSDVHAMKAKTVRCQFLNSVVNFERKELMTFLRRMRAAADVAMPRRLRLLLTTCWRIVVRGRAFTSLDYGPCFDHIDKIVKGEADTVQRCFMVLFPKFVRQMGHSLVDDILQKLLPVTMV